MNRKLLMGALLGSTLVLAGCSDDDDNDPSTLLRAVHLSPDAPAVDVRVNGAEVAGDVTYRQATGFLRVSPGDTPVQVLAANTETAVIDASLDLDRNVRTTVLAVNTLAAIEPLVITDNTAPPADQAALRVVHGAPSVGAVDVYISAPTDMLPMTPTLSNVPFKGISDELEVDAGDYRVRVTATGDTAVVYDSGTLSLSAGVEYVAIASQVADTRISPIGLTILTDLSGTPVVAADDGRARVQVVHASPDAPAVDVTLDGVEVVDSAVFGDATGYLTLLGGEYDLSVDTADGALIGVIEAMPTFAAGSDTTVVALNQVANIEALVLIDDNSAPATGNVKLRVVHAASQAGTVDVFITAPGANLAGVTPTIEDFNFKDVQDYLEVPAGNYQVRITAADTTAPVLIEAANVALAAGDVYTAYALDTRATPLLTTDRD